MAGKVIRIPASQSVDCNQIRTRGKRRVAAYCRVSTNDDDQLLSFDNQVSHYTASINSNPEFLFVGVYADEGISGTSTKRREEFRRMISDCEDGKIDHIITKSISRFARNTQDCLEYSRKLKDLGVSIFFERENINTMDGAGELLFTILSSLAQEESRSISENSKWGIRKKFREGKAHGGIACRLLGYDTGADGNLVINKEQAVVVKRIFDEYLSGNAPEIIAKGLRDDGTQTAKGGEWGTTQIRAILRNEKYKGDLLLQKYYTPDFLTKKIVKNNGELERVFVQGAHEPIVSREVWEIAQMELDREERFKEQYGLRVVGMYTDTNPFSCKIFCGDCGVIYRIKVWTRRNGKHRVWQCTSKYPEKGVIGCHNIHVYEKDLFVKFMEAWNRMMDDQEAYIKKWQKTVKDGNPLEQHYAKRFIKRAKNGKIEKNDMALVNQVLEKVEVLGEKGLNFHFLDGSVLNV